MAPTIPSRWRSRPGRGPVGRIWWWLLLALSSAGPPFFWPFFVNQSRMLSLFLMLIRSSCFVAPEVVWVRGVSGRRPRFYAPGMMRAFLSCQSFQFLCGIFVLDIKGCFFLLFISSYFSVSCDLLGFDKPNVVWSIKNANIRRSVLCLFNVYKFLYSNPHEPFVRKESHLMLMSIYSILATLWVLNMFLKGFLSSYRHPCGCEEQRNFECSETVFFPHISILVIVKDSDILF